VGQAARCPPSAGAEVSVLVGGAEPVDVPPPPDVLVGKPEQPAAAARMPPVSAAAASLPVRLSLIRIPPVSPVPAAADAGSPYLPGPRRLPGR